MNNAQGGSGQSPELIRGIGLAGATSLNMIDMIGVGPFITIPLIVAAMGGPQAMLGWIIGAALVLCDGLVWAELGAAMPGSGGSYRYLKEIYNPASFGRAMAFIFIWQLTFSAPLSIASGCIGLAQYAGYLVPSLGNTLVSQDFSVDIPVIGMLSASIVVSGGTFVAMGACLTAVALLYRKITIIARISGYLWIGVMLTIGWVIFAGLTHFDAGRAFSFPQNAFELNVHFFNGLGAGMLVAVYDYWGYYNVCFLGGELKEPGRTIPRAILISIGLVAVIYIVMNISILGVIPWQELGGAAASDARKFIVSVFMQRVYGEWAGVLATLLIMWTAFASVFSLLLGYSRIPYAAAVDGDYFSPFRRLHPEHQFPFVSLLVLGGVAVLFCLLRLADVIAALVVIRILVQFLAQTVGVIVLRIRRPDLPRPFRMWLYPLPALAAFCGFFYVLVMRNNFEKELRYAAVLVCAGIALFLLRSKRRKEWPFGGSAAKTA
jgi:amino acid transporter